ncbi:hypothetical protein BCP78_0088 [Bacillus phage BCP78]|uniref:Uncharacterized protein n=3 Tax=Tsarbombavirus BCP78 TaxID=1985182 RepID=J9PRL2_9CAUD|nr:hypothetical protein BCP78_0088 [Bacillus phage BCP78]YP_009783451.1 hypothetical protein QLX27_gp078 [Bacillus phage BCU4]AEW47095.1 hypothetical protein BCP78_0088 [Bacillus phage BCP78]AEW47584.1 hypothetical protein BCU4_0078 [Bacillus phage BCU4]AQN32465.1 hypothetical protein BCP12_044 [Bacillus phage BCP12]
MNPMEVIGAVFAVIGMVVAFLVLLVFFPGFLIIGSIVAAGIIGWQLEGRRQERERNKNNH